MIFKIMVSRRAEIPSVRPNHPVTVPHHGD
jgi:hypothetical protein